MHNNELESFLLILDSDETSQQAYKNGYIKDSNDRHLALQQSGEQHFIFQLQNKEQVN